MYKETINKNNNNNNNADIIQVQIYKNNERKINVIKEVFKELTSKDDKLREYFKDTPLTQIYSDVRIAGSIVAGIKFKNIKNLAHKINVVEEIPYSEEQEKLIDKYEDLIMEQKVLGDIFQDLDIEME